MKLRCIVTDDEPLAVEGISRLINQVDFLEHMGACANPIQLDALLKEHTVDLIFLDIQMPLMSGLEYLKTNARLPMVILTTAFSTYALEGYDYDVIDYLVKPITFSRFFKAVSKARDLWVLQQESSTSIAPVSVPDYFFVKCAHKYERIEKASILYVQAFENYVNIFTPDEKFMTLLPLKTVEQYLVNDHFIRTHKSYLVAINKITAIKNHELYIQEHIVPISRSFRSTVLKVILKDRVLKK